MAKTKPKRVIVITGVSSGIGQEFVRYALEQPPSGDVIVGLGRNDAGVVDDSYYKFIPTDLRHSNLVKESIDKVIAAYERIDVLINNAAIGYRGAIEDLPEDKFFDLMQTNLFSPVTLIQKVLPIMRRQKTGHIINVSSLGSIIETPTLGQYAATKAALNKISEVLKMEVQRFGISVSVFYPGAVRSHFGKNLNTSSKTRNGTYAALYDEWEQRFKYFFKHRNSAREAAEKLYHLIDHPRDKSFIRKVDWMISLTKSFLPQFIYRYLLLNVFYKHER